MTRLIANLALEKKIGENLTKMAELETILDKCGPSDPTPNKELTLNIVWCLANISFYASPGSRLFTHLYLGLSSIASFLLVTHIVYIELIPLMMHDNEEIITETCRIIANLSRFTLPAPPTTMSNCNSQLQNYLTLDSNRGYHCITRPRRQESLDADLWYSSKLAKISQNC